MKKTVAVFLVTLGLAAASGIAAARDHVSIGLSFGVPAPVYVAPPPYYYAPPAFYAPPAVYYEATTNSSWALSGAIGSVVLLLVILFLIAMNLVVRRFAPWAGL